MPKGAKVRIKVRKRWVINPRTRVEDSAKLYKRQEEKGKIRKVLKNGS